MSGRISFIGAGPGAADLITVRGARRIADADVVVWTASLVAPECIQEHARADAELVDSSRLAREQEVEIYRRAERDKLKVVRVHPDDPAMWAEVQEQHDACARMDVEVEIVPGVAPFSAAAASIGRELTVPGVAQSLVVTRMAGGKHPMPAGESVREFARHGTTMALHVSASRAGQLVEELRAGGYPDDVPVLVAHKVSCPDETLLRTTVGELEATVKQHKLWRNALFLVGRAVGGTGTPRSRSYSGGQFPTYRRNSGARRGYRSRRHGGAERPVTGSREGSDPLPEAPGPVPEARMLARSAGRSESEVAWWAVREWQDTARDTARSAAARSAAARRVTMPQQQGLFMAEAESEAGVDQELIDRSAELGAGGVAVVEPAGQDARVAEPAAEGESDGDAGATGVEAAGSSGPAAETSEETMPAAPEPAVQGLAVPESGAQEPGAPESAVQRPAGQEAGAEQSKRAAEPETRARSAKTASKSRSKTKAKTGTTRSSSTKRKAAGNKQDGKSG